MFHIFSTQAYNIYELNKGVDVNVSVLEYFPGANTPEGFFSYYDDILKSHEAQRIIVLKGGPGTGKSTFMKKIAKHINSLGYDTELLHCSSDPNSLDGVCSREKGFLILDGTSPHIVDPKCPGAVDEIINLGECWDKEKIKKHKKEIIETGEQISSYFARAYRYMSAAKSLQMQIWYGDVGNDSMKQIKYELEKIKRNVTVRAGTKTGNERRAFLSAITPLGRMNYINTFCENSDIVYKIKSNCQNTAGLFMNGLAQMLREKGEDIRTFYCPMSPDKKIEHIYANGILFTLENDYHKSDRSIESHIIELGNQTNREYDLFSDIEQYNLLLDGAEKMMKCAKELHDKLEEYYIPYMDFGRVEKLCNKVIEDIN